MNTLIQAPAIEQLDKKSDIGFLVALLVLVVLQFLLFHFGVPSFANSFVEKEATEQLIPTGSDTLVG